MHAKHSRSLMHTHFPLSLWIMVNMQPVGVGSRPRRFIPARSKLGYCTLQCSFFTRGVCTFIIYCLHRTSRCFYCLFFCISFLILEHATTPELERGDRHQGWRCCLCSVEGISLARTKYNEFVCQKTILDGWPK